MVHEVTRQTMGWAAAGLPFFAVSPIRVLGNIFAASLHEVSISFTTKPYPLCFDCWFFMYLNSPSD
jgi:hypothetical protein